MDRANNKTEIRKKIVKIISDFVPDLEERVYPVRKIPLGKEKLPACLVYTNSESLTKLDNVNVERNLKVSVELITDGVDEITVSENLDSLSREVEIAFMNNHTLDGLVHESTLTNHEEGFDEEGKSIVGAVRMSYEFVYYTENVSSEGDSILSGMNANVSGYGVESDFEVKPELEEEP